MATRKLVQGVFIGDATRHMGPRSVLRSRYILELEILLRGADDLFRRHYHLLYLGGMDRWKAVGPRLTAFRGQLSSLRERRSYGFAEAAGEAAGGALPAGKTPAPESGAGETPGEV